ncbi:protein of unknown function; putative exported protein [Methylorubrum extorquens]|uniref:Uncharacterized protein n=1 Tax=Methylorubrum extorquens TaxID=408 RepID=A0A2N9AT47_METEX|nr:hypothetical protein B2G69_18385 [Methylorubrum zatmanii]SOR30360.1 protein of unknown function; putative exported protein [Methylorubrum extorquens]
MSAIAPKTSLSPAAAASATPWSRPASASPARRTYARHGFACDETATHIGFGRPVEGETWMLPLGETGQALGQAPEQAT